MEVVVVLDGRDEAYSVFLINIKTHTELYASALYNYMLIHAYSQVSEQACGAVMAVASFDPLNKEKLRLLGVKALLKSLPQVYNSIYMVIPFFNLSITMHSLQRSH